MARTHCTGKSGAIPPKDRAIEESRHYARVRYAKGSLVLLQRVPSKGYSMKRAKEKDRERERDGYGV